MTEHKCDNMSGMDNQQRGILDVLLVPVVTLSILLVGVSVFAYWAFNSRQDYKNNTDQMISAAVSTAIQQTQNIDSKNYAQEEKDPLNTFLGPSSFASVSFQYPKTWSAYVPEDSTSSTPINGYFYPAVVPDTTNQNNAYALRVQLLEQPYANAMQQFSGEVQTGKLAVSQYAPPKLPSVIGSKLTGQLTTNKQGTMVVLPLLNMTLEIWTESSQFESDFSNSVLPSLTFQP
jgi:hypothetical protein